MPNGEDIELFKDWKKELRAALICGLNDRGNDNNSAKVGLYYKLFAPKFLYKYYKDPICDSSGNSCHLNLETVMQNKMWYSAPSNFNDVFDCDIFIDYESFADYFIKELSKEKKIKIGSQVWKNTREFVMHQAKQLKKDLNQYKNTVGISCFCESFESLLMWAHYANNHKGFCVQYELNEICTQLNFTPIPVIYSNEKASLNLNEFDENPDDYKLFVKSLSSKSPEWSYEAEWRIIRDEISCDGKWDAKKKGALLPMILPRSIYLGCEASEELMKKAKEYCHKEKINLYQMAKDDARYVLNKKTIFEYNPTDKHEDK